MLKGLPGSSFTASKKLLCTSTRGGGDTGIFIHSVLFLEL